MMGILFAVLAATSARTPSPPRPAPLLSRAPVPAPTPTPVWGGLAAFAVGGLGIASQVRRARG